MGQYHHPVNLDKKEFINPHKLGSGLKQWEQLANTPGTGAALLVLLFSSNSRGGGDLDAETNWHGPDRVDFTKEGPDLSAEYKTIARAIVGRWAGDRLAIVGDYGEVGDLPDDLDGGEIYGLCYSYNPEYAEGRSMEEDRQHVIDYMNSNSQPPDRAKLTVDDLYMDITDAVCAVIEHELCGKFEGDGWRSFKKDKAA